ncbi:carbohydrate kinase family protein [Paractinoplanes maris]|uniref:carbohydrate kinase family protein n=1 Tax=Paractinoplanes maris TaxID=1734446 RepID=UPI0020215125|nr:carbohydrate kinase family protein [Actinoplanes maris]
MDYLAGASGAGIEHLVPGLEWGTELGVDAATITAVVAGLDPAASRIALGGSAFTTISAMARAGHGLRLGFVGVAGRVPGDRLSALRELDSSGIDRRFVLRDDERLCGICVSVMRGGDRTLVTHAGANEGFPDYLDRESEQVAAYLSRARLIHVTSFLDDRSAGRLLAVLTAAKRLNPRTRISFDPGHVWCANRSAQVDGILALSDYLIVNRRELRELAPADAAVLVVKQPTGAQWFRGGDGGFVPHVPLAEADIVDATGAGDVFAAGLLLELAVDPGRIAAGCERGLGLARRKLLGQPLT